MKEIDFNLKILFSEKIVSDNDVNEIAENIRQAIERQINEKDLAPENSNAFTKEFSITAPMYDIEINHIVIY